MQHTHMHMLIISVVDIPGHITSTIVSQTQQHLLIVLEVSIQRNVSENDF